MSDYTPMTDEVREGFALDRSGYLSGSEGAAEFDRWLAARDAEVRADEREKCAEAIFNEEQVAMRRPNPTDPFRNGFILGLQRARDIAAARGDGEREVLSHADNCDPAFGCTCGTRTLIIRGESS